MEFLHSYIPTDRQYALAYGVRLPEHTTGAALFADISGFTTLTDTLVRVLGPQRGADELTRWINKIYDVLIEDVMTYRGSVITFNGDAITCWFDDQDVAPGSQNLELAPAVLRAVAAALALQKSMGQFEKIDLPGVESVSLAIKVAVSAGSARRFVVGDPDILRIDVLAGKTLDRLAASEHYARRGDIMLDEATVQSLGEKVTISDWASDEEIAELRFARLGKLNVDVQATPWDASLLAEKLEDKQIRPWLLAPVYERLAAGLGEFLTELRPAVALFLSFGGIDYDHDPLAQSKLDVYIQSVQHVLENYNGYLLQLTLGDKGCYLYASFGVPTAHENDHVRAVSAALALRDLPMSFITGVQIGLSQGRMRTGAYGGTSRRTYGVLGDDVNIAARLMQAAPLGGVLAIASISRTTENAFLWKSPQPITLKGKPQPVMVSQLVARKDAGFNVLHEPQYGLPMIGRTAELGLITEKIRLTLRGSGQVIGITAEAGMGKSRLVAETIRIARTENMHGYGGECESYGSSSTYLVWQNIWRTFFDLDPAKPAADQIAKLAHAIGLIDPSLLPRLPLLGATLNLSIPDTDLTGGFDARLRKESLESLLADCIRIRSRSQPILLVLEDCHWMDPLSIDLVEILARVVADLPVLLVLAYRPDTSERSLSARLSSLSYFTEISLADLSSDETADLIRSKLQRLYNDEFSLPTAWVQQIQARADGNPFYVEELINYLHDSGVKLEELVDINQIDLPDSLYSLILSRIDQLSENQKMLLKVASVVGRVFRVGILWSIYTRPDEQKRVLSDLSALVTMDLTQLDIPDPDLTYLFKHVITQEVAYETLSFEQRASLHQQIGRYIETVYRSSLEQYINLLAFHYDRSENLEKRREYLLLAGDAAMAAYSNLSAISYYQKVLPLLDDEARLSTLLKLGQVFELIGHWPEAIDANLQADALSISIGNHMATAQARLALGSVFRKRGDYADAESWLNQARQSYQNLEDYAGVSRTLAEIGEIYRIQGKYIEAQQVYDQSLSAASQIKDQTASLSARGFVLKGKGTLATWQGDYPVARSLNQECLEINRQLGNIPVIAAVLNNQGILARFQQDFTAARQLGDESLSLFRKIGNRWAISQLLNNIACVASDQHDYPEARRLLEEGIAIQRQLDDKYGLALSLNTLADVVLDEGDFSAARPLLDESIALNLEMGDQTSIAYLLADYGCLAAAENRPHDAFQLVGFVYALRETIGARLPDLEQARLDGLLAPARSALSEQEASQALDVGRALSLDQALVIAHKTGQPG